MRQCRNARRIGALMISCSPWHSLMVSCKCCMQRGQHGWAYGTWSSLTHGWSLGKNKGWPDISLLSSKRESETWVKLGVQVRVVSLLV